MGIAYSFFLVFVVLKQFYIFNSGNLQPADIFLMLSLLAYLFSNGFKITFKKTDKLLFFFLISVVMINGYYFILYTKIDFLFSIAYYVFNFLVVILFREYSKNRMFMMNLVKALKFNIIIQYIIFLFGKGRWFGAIRYMGTFNDPNQMAFFLFITILLLFLSTKILEKRIGLFYHLVVIFLIIKTASTGIFIGMAIFYILNISYSLYVYFFALNFKFNKKQVIIISMLIVAIVLSSSLVEIKYQEYIKDSFIIIRVREKLIKSANFGISNASSYNEMTILEERGIDKLLMYPEKIILGSGQGYYSRYIEASHYGEIHSTLPSVLFYYGIIPFCVLILWFYKNIQSINNYSVIVFIPLIIESFALLNQRQPFFWMVFILHYTLSTKKTAKEIITSDHIILSENTQSQKIN